MLLLTGCARVAPSSTNWGYWSAGVGVFAVLVVWHAYRQGRKDKERLSEMTDAEKVEDNHHEAR